MHVALVTCRNLPAGPDDEEPLRGALRQRGCAVHTPVWNDDNVDWATYDVCVIRSTWDYQEHLPRFREWVRHVGGSTTLCNAPDLVLDNTHKAYLRALAERGLRTVPTVWLDAGQSANVGAVMRDRGWRAGVIKPAVGATARETMRFGPADVEAAQTHVDRLLPREDLLLQPYLERVEDRGEISGVFLDGALSHVVRKVPRAGDYRVQDDFGARDGRYEPTPSEGRALHDVIEAAGAGSLYARVDMMWDDEGRLCLGELELVEPLLFFRHAPEAVASFTASILAAVH